MKFDVPEITGTIGQQQIPESFGTWAPYQSIMIQLATSGVVNVLPAAPAGFLYHIKWIEANAATTAYSGAAALYLVDKATNYNFVWSYAQANGIQLNLACDFWIGGAIEAHNSSGVNAAFCIIYRTEPIV